MSQQVLANADADLSFVVPSLLRDLQRFSEQEGISAAELAIIAIAEKVGQLKHEEWVKSRKPMTEERLARFREILAKSGSDEVIPGDELPEGYVRP